MYHLRQSLAITVLGLLTSASVAQQSKPQDFRLHEPGWIIAGKPVVVKLIGQDLNPSTITFQHPGITAKVLSVQPFEGKTEVQRRWGNRMAEVEISTTPDTKPGSYRFTLSGDGVQSVTGRLTVDVSAPEMTEVEPNNELRKPMVLPAGSVTVLGKLDNEGADVFQFTGKAGETWRVEAFTTRLNRETKLEAVLRLRDPRLSPVRAAVDSGNDCALEYRLPADGPYLVELFDGDNRAAGDYNYRLALRRL
jgi:hypothetical protein